VTLPQTISLQSEVAGNRLRASLEHSEAEKQKLEYALFVSRQEVRKLEDDGRQKEHDYSQLTGTLQSKLYSKDTPNKSFYYAFTRMEKIKSNIPILSCIIAKW